MSYTITNYTRSQARKLGVQVKLAKNKKKKLDVFKNGKKVASVGSRGMGDFPTFKKTKGIVFAKKRQKAYKARMEKNRKKVGSPGYYADKLLW